MTDREPLETMPGDLVLTHGHTPIHRVIRWAQAIRYRGARRPYAYWNHAAIVVGEAGEIIEAQARYGVRRSNLEVEYATRQYVVVDVGATPEDRAQIVAFAESCLGQSYGFLTILALVVWVLFGGRVVLGLDGTEICSGLAAQALVRDGVIFRRNPAMMMPADLAEHYGAEALRRVV